VAFYGRLTELFFNYSQNLEQVFAFLEIIYGLLIHNTGGVLISLFHTLQNLNEWLLYLQQKHGFVILKNNINQ